MLFLYNKKSPCAVVWCKDDSSGTNNLLWPKADCEIIFFLLTFSSIKEKVSGGGGVELRTFAERGIWIGWGGWVREAGWRGLSWGSAGMGRKGFLRGWRGWGGMWNERWRNWRKGDF